MTGALISFVAPPYAGHLNPILAIALAALRRGHRVEVITGPGKIATVTRLGLPAHCPPMLADGILEAMPETPGNIFRNPFRILAQMRQGVSLIAPLRDHLIARWRADPPACILADFTAVPAGLAAGALCLPWVTLANPAFVLETHSGPPAYLGGLRPLPGPIGRLRDRTGWAAMGAAKSILFRLFGSDFRALGLTRLRPDGTEAIYSPHAILCPGLPEIEFARSWPPGTRLYGHLPLTPEATGLPPPGPDTRPNVLVTFGTHLPWAKAAMVGQTRALARRLPDVAFTLSLGDAARAGEPPIERSGNVTLRAFVPYQPELSAFDAVIHHGGTGITLATLAAGLPALVCPQDYDQPDWAARIAHFGLGHRIRRIDGNRTVRLLRAVLDAPPPALAPIAERLRQTDAEAIIFASLAPFLGPDPLP
ncbi:MAG: glycosyltransferase family 1 protein [Rubellimicrobium sp.]|nr:glycosyltransferase family 1 protein [Rubellimicrobium sp.]